MVEVGGSTTLYAWAGGSVIAEYNGVGNGMAGIVAEANQQFYLLAETNWGCAYGSVPYC